MSSQETSDNVVGDDASDRHSDQSNDALTSKLSKELSNWRRKRTNARPRMGENSGNGKVRSEPARTIKVRGHETLVIRKSKPAIKPRSDSSPDAPN